MNAYEALGAFCVAAFATFLVFYLGYICGKEDNKPLRDERGRFTKRYW